MKLNERKTEMVPIMKSVLIVIIPIKFTVTENFAIMPSRNVQYLPFILSGFIFGNKDQYSPWHTEHLLN